MTERLQRALSVFGLFPSGTLGNCCTRSSLHRDAQRMLQISLSPGRVGGYKILCLAAPASLMSHHCAISLTLELRELSLTEFRNQNKYMSEYQLKT